MNWFNIIKVKSSKKTRTVARDVRIVLVEAGFPLKYIGDINMSQWVGGSESSKIFQINPAYLIEAANDFNEWVDNMDSTLRDNPRHHGILGHRLANRINHEEAREHIVKLINQAMHKEEKDKHRKETTFGED